MEQETRFGKPLAGPVTADAVEEALASSWQNIRSARDVENPVARASVLSLVACVVDPSSTARMLDAIHNLSRQHPSRTIILLPDGSSSDEDVRIWHATGCSNGDERERVVCGEQIVIAARGRAIDYLPSLTDQLMLADLPSFLWWVGDLSPSDDALLDRLTELADRLVVDSSDFSSLTMSTSRLDRLARRRHQPCAPSDLNWARLTAWRELVAQFFDSPALRPHLYHLDGVAVDYGTADGAGLAQTMLLIGWLASQLHWTLNTAFPIQQSGPTVGSLRRPDGGSVSVSARPTTSGQVAGLLRLTLTAGDTGRFIVSREADGVHALTEADVSGAPVLRRIAHCETADLSSLLGDELAFFQRDHVYESALHLAVALAAGAKPA
jgi:glucose-6-phosphate dehydrogenase assembly protein OpcA